MSPPSCAFPTGLSIGFEQQNYTFMEPPVLLMPILEVALVTSIASERRFVTEIRFMNRTAVQDVGRGGDYSFSISRVIFDPNVTREIVQFALVPDIIAEQTESFIIRATRSIDGPAYDCIEPDCIPDTTIFILDDDCKHSAFQCSINGC